MSDPYNSVGAQMAAPPPIPASTVQRPAADPIARLDVSESWKRRFRLIEKAGGPKLRDQRTALTSRERLNVNFNLWGFLFGFLYYLCKGLWRPALGYLGVAIAISMVLNALGIRHASGPGTAFGIIMGMRANVLYYQLKVLDERPWF